MKVLVFGKNGQVGWELQRALAPLGELIALGRADRVSPRAGWFEDTASLAATVQSIRPDVIVNAAAYTAVDRAEAEPDLARSINATAPAVLATAAASIGALLVHYSTDYVFDGSGAAPWTEDDTTGPLNVYGRTKLEGEQGVRASGCRHLIFRTGWVYASRGNNFARTMLRLASERDVLRVVDDQFGAPTGADLLADVTAHAVRAAMERPVLEGTYHVSASGVTTWHAFASHVIETARAAGLPMRVGKDDVHAVSSTEYATAAKRPGNTRLDTRKFRSAFHLVLPDWRSGVDRMLIEMLGR